MPSQTTSTPLTVTVLAALWVGLGRCGVSESPGPGCDNGKLHLDMDLSVDAVHWHCPVSTWPESTQRLPSADTVYDPEPARQVCMDKSISYNHTIPNSGAYRPVKAESGEYLYCPPQRWLNNLHHAATVLLYHPCAPLRERLLLSALARSCLPDFIVTPHPQLQKHKPIALVSWGRTLELSTAASSDVCRWLETTTSTRNTFGGVSQSGKYNLLLTWSAEQHQQQQHAHPEEPSAKMKESLRRCCEQAIESNMKAESLKQIEKEGKSRRIRAAIREKQESIKDEKERGNTATHVSSVLSHQTNKTILNRTADAQSYNSRLGPSAHPPPGNRTLSDPPGPREAPSQSKIQNINQGLTPRPATPVGPKMPETTLRTDSLEFKASESQKSLQTAAQQPGPKHTDFRKLQPTPSAGLDVLADGEHNHTARPEALALRSKDEESPPQPRHDPIPQPASYLPSSHDCGGCKEGDHCECSKDSGAEARAAVANNGLPRTPRTDEAVWAAAALGFLLVLLTLSVLHTRLYRFWRTTPSLYWHDPQQDYDSVADVIRRRLRIAKRRRKRGRRQECVLLPSSSSSDEHQ
ncbi:tumor protein p53-inducible protein 13 isoform X2 [Pempheris klunzingeri]|uniref:tumor protein p53-inducible protein 13 isoform X2 n=1 Tax=Pempheris klunzingeri TaxID=3127111 RepID=UPI00397F4C81